MEDVVDASEVDQVTLDGMQTFRYIHEYYSQAVICNRSNFFYDAILLFIFPKIAI